MPRPTATSDAMFPKITEQGLDDLRQRIGVRDHRHGRALELRGHARRIRHYAHGIGDDNPLWCDPGYAANTRVRRRSSRCRASCSRPAASSRATSAACPASTRCGPAPTGPGTSRCCATTRSRPRRAQGPDRAPDARSPAARSSRSTTSTSSTSTATWSPRPTSWCFRTDRDERASAARSTPRQGAAAPSPTPTSSSPSSTRSTRTRKSAARARATGRTSKVGERAAAHGEGPDDGHRLHRLRAGLGRPLHPRQQARLEADHQALRARHQEPLQRARLPRARALGGRVRARGRRAGRLRLRPGALLLADPPPDQLDGRRRLPAPRALPDPPPQSRRRRAVHRGHRRRQVRRGRPAPGRDRAGGAQPGRRAVGRRRRRGRAARAAHEECPPGPRGAGRAPRLPARGPARGACSPTPRR